MFPIVISSLQTTDGAEIVERKGIGHPDTICDALAETLSRDLCREYQRRFGEILHHNVDTALLCGGRAVAAFGGGNVTAPIRSTYSVALREALTATGDNDDNDKG